MTAYNKHKPLMFKFLPENMTHKPSKGGFSLHASEHIEAGTCLGVIRVHFTEGNYLDGQRFVRTAGWAELANCDDVNPSCVTVQRDRSFQNPAIDYVVQVWTMRDLELGDEITWRYTLPEYDDVPWRRLVVEAGYTMQRGL